MAKLRDAEQLLGPAVAATLTSLGLGDSDAAAARLARHYAAAIDASHCSECGADTTLDTLGPKLLAALDALGATPAARARMLRGGGQHAGTGRLQALRDTRRA
ncbi:MAG: terminase small subunit [Actinomycetota bacterium]